MSEPQQPPSPPRASAPANGFLARLVHEVVHGQTLLVTFLAVVTALLFGALLIILSEDATRDPLGYITARPSDFFRAVGDTVGSAYAAMFRGAFSGPSAWSETLVAATPLVFTGLAFALPFRALLINIGGEGQFIFGGLAGALVGFGLTGVPLVIHLPLTVLAGAIGGAAAGWLPGILKARTGAHEVIVTIMLNNVGLLFMGYVLQTSTYQTPGRDDPISKAVTANLPRLFGGGHRVHTGFLLALVMAAASWWLIERSTYGFEVKAVGHNPRAARFAGMSPERVYWSILLLGGAMAGLGGITQAAGLTPYRLTLGFSAGLGFDGITVALLGRSRPGGIVLAALLFGALEAGGLRMQAVTQISLDLVTVIQAMVVILIAAPALIRALYRVKAVPEEGLETAAGWSA